MLVCTASSLGWFSARTHGPKAPQLGEQARSAAAGHASRAQSHACRSRWCRCVPAPSSPHPRCAVPATWGVDHATAVEALHSPLAFHLLVTDWQRKLVPARGGGPGEEQATTPVSQRRERRRRHAGRLRACRTHRLPSALHRPHFIRWLCLAARLAFVDLAVEVAPPSALSPLSRFSSTIAFSRAREVLRWVSRSGVMMRPPSPSCHHRWRPPRLRR